MSIIRAEDPEQASERMRLQQRRAGRKYLEDLEGTRSSQKRTLMICGEEPNGSTPSSTFSLEPRSCVTEAMKGSHQFIVKRFSLTKGMGVGKYIASDSFTAGGHRWAIYVYPDGKHDSSSLYVSVFIALSSDATDVQALFELTLVDQSSNGRHKRHSHFNTSRECQPYTLKYRGSMWGYKRFFRREVLERSDFYKDDSLILMCTVGVIASSSVQSSELHPMMDQEMGQQFASLEISGKGSGSSGFESRSLLGKRLEGRQLGTEAEEGGKL